MILNFNTPPQYQLSSFFHLLFLFTMSCLNIINVVRIPSSSKGLVTSYKSSRLLVVTYFWVPTKEWENTKKYQKKYSEEIQKIIGARKGCWNTEKMPKLVEEIQKCKRLKFESGSPVDKENSIWGRKVQNQIFMDSIKFYPRFNWIYGGFDCKKIDLLSQFRLLLEEIKLLGSNYNFEELI